MSVSHNPIFEKAECIGNNIYEITYGNTKEALENMRKGGYRIIYFGNGYTPNAMWFAIELAKH